VTGPKTIVLDRETGAHLGQRSNDPGATGEMTILAVEQVDRVPPSVRRPLEHVGDGGRSYGSP
jgi:hypothetical protein